MKKYDIPMIKTAQIWADMSYCKRAKVGAVLSQENRIISIGYNGSPTGMDNECEDTIYKCSYCNSIVKKIEKDIFYCDVCQKYIFDPIKEVKTNHNKVIHAEANTILFCAKNGIKTNGATLYVTLSPCPECAKMILQAGIKRVVYLEKYRKNDGLKLLKENGVEVEQIKLGGGQ